MKLSLNDFWSILRVFFSLTIGIGTIAYAGNGGSGYSRYGLGDIWHFQNSRAMGMGGASIGVLTPHLIDRLNPSAWAKIDRTRFSIGVMYEGFSTKDASRSAFLSETQFNGMMIAIPIATKSGIVAVAGFTPLSRINYNIIEPSSQEGLSFNTQYIGDGGLSQALFGFSLTLASDIHLGANLDYYFGTLNYSTKQLFSGTQYTNAEVRRTLELQGLGFTFGTIYSGLTHLFGLNNQNKIHVGLVLSTRSYLTSNEERFYTYTTTTLTTHDTTSLPEGTIRLPLVFSGGISYSTESLLLAADVHHQRWSRLSGNGIAVSELRNSYRYGIGGELLPKRDRSASFKERIAYRFGLFYHSTYYHLKGIPINEWGITGGLGIPIFSETRLNIGVEYSFRGTTEKGLQKDNILRISLTLNGSDQWFVRPQQE